MSFREGMKKRTRLGRLAISVQQCAGARRGTERLPRFFGHDGHVKESVVTLFRPVGQKELGLIAESGFRRFPPRLAQQPIFYPVVTEAYAIEIARDWNARDEASGHVGFVTRFQVRASYLAGHMEHVGGAYYHREYWIPSEELATFNDNIVGPIEVVAEFRKT